MTHMFVKITTPLRLRAEDIHRLLERCDSMLPDNVCRCISTEQFDNLISSLKCDGFEYEVLDEKPMTKPLGKYVIMILDAWLRDQEALWRGSR